MQCTVRLFLPNSVLESYSQLAMRQWGSAEKKKSYSSAQMWPEQLRQRKVKRLQKGRVCHCLAQSLSCSFSRGRWACTACILGNARNGFPFAENIYHWLCLWKNRAENVIEPANHQYLGLRGRAEDLRGRTRLLSCFPAWLLAGWWRGAKWLWFDVCLLAHPSLGAQ